MVLCFKRIIKQFTGVLVSYGWISVRCRVTSSDGVNATGLMVHHTESLDAGRPPRVSSLDGLDHLDPHNSSEPHEREIKFYFRWYFTALHVDNRLK